MATVRRRRPSRVETATGKLCETHLYGPVRDYLVAQGYTVRGEVHGCDVTAVKDDDLIIVELKRSPSLALLVQATQRQRAGGSVYVAVPRPAKGLQQSRWRGIRHLLRRLELGLILVDLAAAPRVEVVFHPLPFDRKRSAGRRRAVLQEIAGRSGDHNLGGSTRRPLLTAYREQALYIAYCLSHRGRLSPRALRDLGTGDRTLSILSNNVYGWFERVDRGVYDLKPQGRTALKAYPEPVKAFAKRLRERVAERPNPKRSP